MKSAASKKGALPEAANGNCSSARMIDDVCRQLEARAANDAEFVGDAVAEMRAGGPCAALFAEPVKTWFESRRWARLARRDAFLVEAAGFFVGGPRDIAKQLAEKLRRYRSNAWRKHRWLGAHPGGSIRTLEACLFDILKQSGENGALGERRIADILTHCFRSKTDGNPLHSRFHEKRAIL